MWERKATKMSVSLFDAQTIHRHSFECYTSAVRQLATLQGSFRDRLYLACMAVGKVESDDLPDELKAGHDWVLSESKRLGDRHPDELPVQATIKRIRKAHADRLVRCIVDMQAAMTFNFVFGDPIRPPQLG